MRAGKRRAQGLAPASATIGRENHNRRLQFPIKSFTSLTIPDVSLEDSEHLYPLAFVMSMAWLAVFAYLVVAACDGIHEDFGISTSVLGYTVAAAGTSFPNVFSGMCVARQGKTTMAVANALGANEDTFGGLKRRGTESSDKPTEAKLREAAEASHGFLSVRAFVATMSAGGVFYAAYTADKMARAWLGRAAPAVTKQKLTLAVLARAAGVHAAKAARM
ncbi:unnamed protein product [Effrenium voratum]|uniref:Sodium/calcium exchanger membrane region domain-containing protein n=1 Tax=Effrenium voratum TaxID=2562239 RepID=A0AA36IWH3_9DINO|nr:unnamed protein product [Effrenium voratum]